MRALVLLVVLLTASLAPEGSRGRKPAPVPEQRADVTTVTDGNSLFAVDLYRQLRAGEGNLFFSPYSISTALAMTYAGARGETARQMAGVLHFGLPDGRLHAAMRGLMGDVREAAEAEGCELSIANALWGQAGYDFRAGFMNTCRDDYGAGLHEVDFASAAEAARQRINAWVARETRDKIKDLIAPGVLTALTRLVLTNAIYFKGDWQSPFKEAATRDESFWISATESVTAPLMHQAGDFGYAELEQCQVLELPYAGDDLSMVVVLPRTRDGLKGLEDALTQEALSGWLKALRRRKVAVTLPRFKLTCQFQLADVLQKMGMKDAFSMARADLSGMNGRRDLYISHVIHKAFVDVNEEGTEAAAATAVVIALRSAPQRPAVFRADHPFVFVIRHKPSGSILFMGRVANPVGR